MPNLFINFINKQILKKESQEILQQNRVNEPIIDIFTRYLINQIFEQKQKIITYKSEYNIKLNNINCIWYDNIKKHRCKNIATTPCYNGKINVYCSHHAKGMSIANIEKKDMFKNIIKRDTIIGEKDFNYLFRNIQNNNIHYCIDNELYYDPNDILISFTDTLVRLPQKYIKINGKNHKFDRGSSLFFEIFKNMIEFTLRNLDINIHTTKRKDYREYDITNTEVTMVDCNRKLVHLKFIEMINNKLNDLKDDSDTKIYYNLLNKQLDYYKYDYDMDWRV